MAKYDDLIIALFLAVLGLGLFSFVMNELPPRSYNAYAIQLRLALPPAHRRRQRFALAHARRL